MADVKMPEIGGIPPYDITPVHLKYSEEAIKATGSFFLASATAEASLMFVLAELQCHPNQVTINALQVLHGMQNKVMLQKLSDAVATLAPGHHKEMHALCEKIRRLFEHRNNIAHFSAVMGDGDNIHLTIFKSQITSITYSPSQIRGYTDRLYQLVRHLSTRIREIGVKSTPELTPPASLEPDSHLHQAQTPNG